MSKIKTVELEGDVYGRLSDLTTWLALEMIKQSNDDVSHTFKIIITEIQKVIDENERR